MARFGLTGRVAEQKRSSGRGKGGKHRTRTLYLIKQLQYKTYVRLEDALRPLGITSAQFRIMITLHDHAGRSSAELSRMFGVKPQTMIKQIAILENRGLVTRAVAESNKRVLEVELSEEGERVLAKATAEAAALDKKVFAVLGAEEFEQYRATTLKLLQSLDKTDHEAEEYELVPGQLKRPG